MRRALVFAGAVVATASAVPAGAAGCRVATDAVGDAALSGVDAAPYDLLMITADVSGGRLQLRAGLRSVPTRPTDPTITHLYDLRFTTPVGELQVTGWRSVHGDDGSALLVGAGDPVGTRRSVAFRVEPATRSIVWEVPYRENNLRDGDKIRGTWASSVRYVGVTRPPTDVGGNRSPGGTTGRGEIADDAELTGRIVLGKGCR